MDMHTHQRASEMVCGRKGQLKNKQYIKPYIHKGIKFFISKGISF